MNRLEKWTIMFQNNKYPCFLADRETNKLVYANYEFFKLYNSTETLIGKNYHDFFDLEDVIILNKSEEPWDMTGAMTIDIFSKKTQTKLRCCFVTTQDYSAIFCIIKPEEDDEDNNQSYDETLSLCVSLMHSEEDSTKSILSVLGQYYNADKACLFLINDTSFPCVKSWTKNASTSANSDLSKLISNETLLSFFNTRNESGIIDVFEKHSDNCKDISHSEILNAFKLDDALFSVIENKDNEPIGVVIISNRRRHKTDFRLLQAISSFLENKLTKNQITPTYDLNDKDILTGLYNRIGYSKQLNILNENPPETLGVISANINGLKHINDNFGISGGDDLIRHTAKQLKDYFQFEFFRMSGDEFIGLAPNISKENFESKIFVLHSTMKNTNNLDYSLGHAWESGKYALSNLLKEAETIMYINKQEYYRSSHRNFEGLRDSVLSDLLSYLENDEFMIYLQPQVNLKDSSLYGAEALIRRFDKTNQKMVFPDQFISLYEQKSVIRHVDLFVVEAVCKLLSDWGKSGKAIPISVNLSRVTLQEYGIVDTIVEICDRYNVPHKLLVIEVTERVGLIENNVASALITAFKEQNFHISLDDFGCAYSNIVTLAQIEVDEVKIDKSLVDDLTTSSKNHILVKNVLSMCNELEGASTLAEGIEHEEQAKLLYELGCRLGQGYFYSRPLSVEQFTKKYIK